MESSGTDKGRLARVSARCRLCDSPIYNVCDQCTGLLTVDNSNCPRPGKKAGLPKVGNGEKPQGAVTDSGSSIRSMLREGGKMLESFTKNVASATDHLFRIKEEDEEDIDRVVEEFKKAQLEEQGKK